MVKLRPYQEKLLQKAQKALEPPDARVMLQLPTGSGKTRIAAALLAEWVRGGGKAAWLTHRRELSDQTRDVLNNSGVYATNTLEWEFYDLAPAISGGVVVLMAQTVSRRNHFEGVWNEYGPKDLLIIDEAHHATAHGWQRAIHQWPGRVIGLTATPWRLEKNLGFNHLFHSLILGPQISELQAKGFLADAEVVWPDSDGIIIGGRLSSNGEYIEREIELANEDRPGVMTAGALEFWQRHAPGRQTIVYAVSVGHAENLSRVFNDADVPAGVILGNMLAKERDRAINQFKDKKLKVLVNVAVATEGVDLPDASCVVLARPTMSLALYLQMVGRGLRPKDDGGNCLILDLAGNSKSEMHGLPNVEREWSLEPSGQQSEGGHPRVIRCRDCERVSPAAKHDCKHCGSPFGKTCLRCGDWRAWKRWSAVPHCHEAHDEVCDLCHPDAHILANLPVTEGLKEMLRKTLNENLTEVNPSSLQSLEDVQDRICELAENLVHAKRIGDMATLNLTTEQFKLLLKRETQLKRVRLSEVSPKLKADLNEVFRKLGDEVTHLNAEYNDEKGVRITFRLNGGKETVLNWLPWWDSMRTYLQD